MNPTRRAFIHHTVLLAAGVPTAGGGLVAAERVAPATTIPHPRADGVLREILFS